MLSSLVLVSLAFGCDCDRVWECKGESRASKAAHTIAFEAILIKQAAAAAKLTPWLLLLLLLLLHVVYMALCRLSPLRLFGCSAVWLFGCLAVQNPCPFCPASIMLENHVMKNVLCAIFLFICIVPLQLAKRSWAKKNNNVLFRCLCVSSSNKTH